MSTILKWGLITGMVYIFFSLVSNLLGLQQGTNFGLSLLIGTLLLLATFYTIYLGVKETKEELAGEFFTTGQGFMAGFKIVLIAAAVSAIFTFIYLEFIDPNVVDHLLSDAEDKWDEIGVPEENRDSMRKWAGYMANPIVITAISLVSVIFWGAIKALVAGLMLKKNPVVPSA